MWASFRRGRGDHRDTARLSSQVAGPNTAGRRLGRYHLGDPLGGGPCGAVYRAKVYGVAGFERQFAVKRFHPELVAQPIVSQRLSQAARAYGSLEHPRIARLHEYGVAAGEVFTATEMVTGLDAMRLIAATHGAGAPLPPGAALAVVTQAARAVGYAHGRGVNHLGVCPTNVIVMPDGDVKVTDFGIVAQTFTIRPSDDPRLNNRMHYLAPEQLVNEPTSSATDVFAFGALLHELVTGERAFVGVTSLDIEQAVLSAHVRDAGLPKPMARVLARCFARSPFERFPDARALADAIDAALRVAPAAGSKRELGQIVKDAVARLEAMNEAQLSGAMPIAMPTGAPRAPAMRPPTEAPTTIRDPNGSRAQPLAHTLRGHIPPPIVRRVQTKPPSTQPIAPIALRTPQGTVPVPVGSMRPFPDDDTGEHTIQRDSSRTATLAPSPGALPDAPPRTPMASPPPFQAPPPARTTPPAFTPPPTPPPRTTPPPFPAQPRPAGSAEPRGGSLRLDSAWPTGEREAIRDGSSPLMRAEPDRPSEPMIEVIDNDSEGVPVEPRQPFARPGTAPRESEAAQRLAVSQKLAVPATAGKRTGVARLLLFLVLCAGVGTGGVLAWNRWLRGGAAAATGEPVASVRPGAGDTPTTPAVPAPIATTDAAPAKVATPPAGEAAADAAVAKTAAAPVDAGAAVAVAPRQPGGPTDALLIESTPAGAHVYVDGADQGVTPARIAPSADRHSIALVLSGFDLYVAEVDGTGLHRATLTEITPPAGPAGIKVKCKAKERYYVYVDGKPTGQMCPTERIGVDVGAHTVEVYDLVSEERRSYPARVKDTRVSLRVKVDAD